MEAYGSACAKVLLGAMLDHTLLGVYCCFASQAQGHAVRILRNFDGHLYTSAYVSIRRYTAAYVYRRRRREVLRELAVVFVHVLAALELAHAHLPALECVAEAAELVPQLVAQGLIH